MQKKGKFPRMSSQLGKMLTSEDAAITGKKVLGLGAFGALVGLAFSDKDAMGHDILDYVIPSAEGHSSTISNNSGQGVHSSHGNHASS